MPKSGIIIYAGVSEQVAGPWPDGASEEVWMRIPTAIFFLFWMSMSAAAAQTPVAVVEDLKGNVPDVEFMDYVAPGKIIKLGANGSIVLSYMSSCVRETVNGGVVMVGKQQSTVTLGQVDRVKVPCEGDTNQLIIPEATQSAATTFRGMGGAVTLFGSSPIIALTQPAGKLTIERIDTSGEPKYEVALGQKDLVKGRFYDMASAGKSLTAGATYVVALGPKRTMFKIAPDAKPGSTPVIGRLVKL
jgi:hypothetical protein